MSVPFPSGGEVVVVTGAAGFLGLKVVELLNTRGRNIQEIRGFDICPRQPSYFLQNRSYGGHARLTYMQGDICNYEEVGGMQSYVEIYQVYMLWTESAFSLIFCCSLWSIVRMKIVRDRKIKPKKFKPQQRQSCK